MNTVVSLSERGTSFATRTKAAEIIREIAEIITITPDIKLTIDLTSVRIISPSFAAALIEGLRLLLNRIKYPVESISIIGDSQLVQGRLHEAFEQNITYAKNAQSLNRVLIS